MFQNLYVREKDSEREWLGFQRSLAKDLIATGNFSKGKRAFILILLWVWHLVLQI